eukprot:TRINITY_DN12592_c0_g1_i1.p1 TRINITY_DN12592_c0_g1~~TRINITY_DN12592_c0_g1_i1.p1  ORF type:complete len:370 (-),score=59.30 TRINITY_DN12592_c0_g1_i1:199-1308(-)
MGSCWSTRVKAESALNVCASPRSGRSSGEGKMLYVRSEDEILQSCNLKNYSYSELKTVTKNFRPDSVLGEGGFGCVFKGWIDEHTLAPAKPGMGIVVAVKKLNHGSFQGHREWLTEVNYLGQLSHPNLVKLIGYCLEDDHRMLVYEFMAKGSLENHLFKRKGTVQPLCWATRIKIALGAAKGLSYLHYNNKKKIIYRDFKASNILLDSDYNVKLSDFGLARDGPTESETHVSTRVIGTYGYAAPEYLATGHLTTKSDVYSFGVVLLELLSGRRAIDDKRGSREENLVEWAKPFMRDRRKLYKIMDPKLEGQYSVKVAYAAALLALQCLNTEPRLRPNMKEVLQRVEQLLTEKEFCRPHPSKRIIIECSQ